MVSTVQLASAVARAKIRVKKEREEKLRREQELQQERARLIEEISQAVLQGLPQPKDGRDGNDAPSLEAILSEVEQRMPKPIEPQVIREEVSDERILALMPEQETRTEVQLIEKDVDLSGYVTQEDLKEALRKVQGAIVYSGGGGNYTDLKLRIERLERLQAPFTADETDVTSDTTLRTADEI